MVEMGDIPAPSKAVDALPISPVGKPGSLAALNGSSAPAAQPRFSKNDHIITTATMDSRLHAGVIVDHRSDSSGTVEYFVHYDHWDKRTDEWIPHSKIQPYSEELASQCVLKRPNGAEEICTQQRMTRRQRGHLEHSSIKGEFAALDYVDGKVQGKDVDDDGKHPLKARFTEKVIYGDHLINAWYQSPLPPPFDTARNLYFCPYTLKYFRKRRHLQTHLAAMPAAARRPPGDRIYESPLPGRQYRLSTPERPALTAACEPRVSVFEVDGATNRLYCQNLCLLSKIFLDGKTLVWEVHEFMFYVLCEMSDAGDEMVGYFSREKRSESNHLACILTMPHKQRRGYGSLLIDFSYTLARLAEKPGSPERPLSDLGQAAFVEYWERELIQTLLELPLSDCSDVTTLSKRSGICQHDIIETLAQPGCRLEGLKTVSWKRTGYEVDVRSAEALQIVYTHLTEGKHRLVVAPDCLSAAVRRRLAALVHHPTHRG